MTGQGSPDADPTIEMPAAGDPPPEGPPPGGPPPEGPPPDPTVTSRQPSLALVGGFIAIIAIGVIAWLVFLSGLFGSDDPEPSASPSASASASASASVEPSASPSTEPTEAPTPTPAAERRRPGRSRWRGHRRRASIRPRRSTVSSMSKSTSRAAAGSRSAASSRARSWRPRSGQATTARAWTRADDRRHPEDRTSTPT